MSADVLPFMELDGYKRLRECEALLAKQELKIRRMEELLQSETTLRRLYEKIADVRLRKIHALERGDVDATKESKKPSSNRNSRKTQERVAV